MRGTSTKMNINGHDYHMGVASPEINVIERDYQMLIEVFNGKY